jgi:hypothetical protein
VESVYRDDNVLKSSETRSGGYAPINAEDRDELTRIATRLSRTASRPQDTTLKSMPTLELPHDDPSLDPLHKRYPRFFLA